MLQDSKDFLRKLGILAALVAAALVAYELRSLLFVLAFSAFLVALFSPALNAMNRWKIPDFLGVLVIFFGISVLAGTVFATTFPIFAKQSVALFEAIRTSADRLSDAYAAGGAAALPVPEFLRPALAYFDPASAIAAVRDNVGGIAKSLAGFLSSVGTKGVGAFSAVGASVADFALLVVFTFFLTLERHAVRNFFYRAAPKAVSGFVREKEGRIVTMLSSWVKGQTLLGMAIFSATLIGLNVLDFAFGIRLENRFGLALVAGITEFVPYVGPLLALLPALALALGMGPEATVAVLALYLLIQQFENNVLVPALMSKSLDLSPFYVLVMTVAGASLGGVLGILLALPIAGVLRILSEDWIERPEGADSTPSEPGKGVGRPKKIDKLPRKRTIGAS